MITSYYLQDTIKPRLVVRINTDKLPDSIFQKLELRTDSHKLASSGHNRKSIAQIPVKNEIITDTTTVSYRNSIADITFYDSLNFIARPDHSVTNRSPFLFVENNKLKHKEEKITLIKNLKEGMDMPVKAIHNDWIIIVVFVSVFMFSLIKSTSRRILPEVSRFFLLRGINEPASRDLGTLFYWQSTILNLVSFIIIGLFGYLAAAWYDFIPAGISASVFFIISTGIVVLGITSRHFICRITGNLSGETEVFNEYLIGVYQSYRLSSILLFVLIVMLVYTVIFPPDVYFVAALVLFIIMYTFRILRLFLIFIKRDISIFYLILYLCALEILPVLILLKYFTGLG